MATPGRLLDLVENGSLRLGTSCHPLILSPSTFLFTPGFRLQLCKRKLQAINPIREDFLGYTVSTPSLTFRQEPLPLLKGVQAHRCVFEMDTVLIYSAERPVMRSTLLLSQFLIVHDRLSYSEAQCSVHSTSPVHGTQIMSAIHLQRHSEGVPIQG